MKGFTLVIVMSCVMSVTHSYAQFSTQKIIDSDAFGAWSAFVGDIDGDTLNDVVVANMFGNSITWYKQLDANTNFGNAQLIGDVQDPIDVTGADLDNDGDLDVIAALPSADMVVLFENIDGFGTFSSPIIISNTTIGANDVKTIDIDNDGDLDIFIASDGSGISWHRNEGANLQFSNSIEIVTVGNSTRDIFLSDIDGDGLVDFTITSSGSVKVSWYRHLDGNGTFGTATIVHTAGLAMQRAFTADIDMDGDQDIITTTGAEDKISWFENLDGLGNFGAQQVISTVANGAITISVADMDNDGDPDIVCGDAVDGEVTYYENLDGQGNFGNEIILNNTSPSLRSVQTADLNNDGFLDIVAASRNDNTVAWYENLIPLALEENTINASVTIFPNPVKEILHFTSIQSITNVKIYTITGQLINEYIASNKVSINVSHLSSGTYIVTFETSKGIAHKKILVN